MAREIIQRFNVYPYSELSEKAKEKVYEWYLNDPFRPTEFESFVNEDIKVVFPYSEMKVQFSLGYCQGDGLNIYGSLDAADILNITTDKKRYGDQFSKFWDVFTEKEIRTIKFYASELSPISVTENRRYCYCIAFRLDIADEWGYELGEYSNLRNINYKLIEKFEKVTREIISAYCKSWEAKGYDFFYKANPEEIQEFCNANEYEFLEDGTHFVA